MARPRFTVEGGRQIYFDGAPFVGISREGNTQPYDADRVTHLIAALLNKSGTAVVIARGQAFRAARGEYDRAKGRYRKGR